MTASGNKYIVTCGRSRLVLATGRKHLLEARVSAEGLAVGHFGR